MPFGSLKSSKIRRQQQQQPHQEQQLPPESQQPGVNFINILWAAFTVADPESAKNTDNLTVSLHFWDLSMYKLLVEH